MFEGLETAAVSIAYSTQPPVVMPEQYGLNQNYPNPFNPTTQISFALPEEASVKLEIYDLRGQLVKTLVDSKLDIGYHTIEWDATNDRGFRVPTGVYFYKLTTSKFTKTMKMVLIK